MPVDWNPAALVGEASIARHRRRAVRRDVNEQVKFRGGAIGETDLARRRIDLLDLVLRAVDDAARFHHGAHCCANLGAGHNDGLRFSREKHHARLVAHAPLAQIGVNNIAAS